MTAASGVYCFLQVCLLRRLNHIRVKTDILFNQQKECKWNAAIKPSIEHGKELICYLKRNDGLVRDIL